VLQSIEGQSIDSCIAILAAILHRIYKPPHTTTPHHPALPPSSWFSTNFHQLTTTQLDGGAFSGLLLNSCCAGLSMCWSNVCLTFSLCSVDGGGLQGNWGNIFGGRGRLVFGGKRAPFNATSCWCWCLCCCRFLRHVLRPGSCILHEISQNCAHLL